MGHDTRELTLAILVELLIQVLAEELAEFGLHVMAAPFRKPAEPWLASIGYLIFGCALGGLSLTVDRNHITADGLPRIANLVLTPIAWVRLWRWRARRGDRVLRIDRFFYGYMFALGFASVR